VRHNLVEGRKRRRRREDYRWWERSAAMALWQMDVMGRVFLSGGQEVKVVTGIDDHSRFIICATVAVAATARPVCGALMAALVRPTADPASRRAPAPGPDARRSPACWHRSRRPCPAPGRGRRTRPRKAGGEDRRRPSRETGQALLVSNGPNAESARRHDLLLQFGQREHARGRRDRTSAEHPGELPQCHPGSGRRAAAARR
jgi:hypothetical protein